MLYFDTDTPIGTLSAQIHNGKLLRLELADTANAPTCTAEPTHADITAMELLKHELAEYFRGERTCFTLEIEPHGTPFQQDVWAELCRIPFGETRTYGEIAKAVGKAGASRAVGQACHVNHILLLIPCHRVVSSSGVGGFALGDDVKKFLLELEGRKQN